MRFRGADGQGIRPDRPVPMTWWASDNVLCVLCSMESGIAGGRYIKSHLCRRPDTPDLREIRTSRHSRPAVPLNHST